MPKSPIKGYGIKIHHRTEGSLSALKPVVVISRKGYGVARPIKLAASFLVLSQIKNP
jgi:hypothetical protein